MRSVLPIPRDLVRHAVDVIIDRSLEEDLAGGDLTTECCVDADRLATAEALAKQELVVCGGEVFARVMQRVEPRIEVDRLHPDGALVPARTVVWRVQGPARGILMAERVALNLVQRMSGIATLARTYAAALPEGSTTRVTDTRKTTPGLRHLERYAVRMGGAHNHRDNLGSAVMIKDNHIVAAGGITAAVERARQLAPHTSRIEVEVTSQGELDEALRAGADVVLLDNMDDDAVRAAVARARAWARPPIIEASGGITLARVGVLAEAGVDVISVGALTHSAPAADISLDIVLAPTA